MDTYNDNNINLLIEALKSEKKTNADVERIFETISTLTFFNKFMAEKLKDANREGLKYICKAMKHESYPKGSFVFMQGDPSNNKFYVVLSGILAVILKESVKGVYNNNDQANNNNIGQPISKSIYANNGNGGSNNQSNTDIVQEQGHNEIKNIKNENLIVLNVLSKFTKRNSLMKVADKFKRNSLHSRFRNSDSRKGSEEIEEKSELDRLIEKNGHKVRELALGQSFGEKALENNENRSASILCMTDVDLLILQKEDYTSMFGKLKKKKVDFLSKVLPFQNEVASSRTLEFLVQEFKDVVLSKGTIITSPEETPDKNPKIYLIEKGECIIEKLFTPSIQEKYKSGLKPCWVKICNIGRGNIIGEELLTDGVQNYDFRISVSSKTLTALYIKKKEFKSNFPKEFMAQIHKTYQTKKEIRDELYQKILNETIHNQKNLIFLKNNHSVSIKDKKELKMPKIAGRNIIIANGSELESNFPQNTNRGNSKFDIGLSIDFNDQKTPKIFQKTTSKQSKAALRLGFIDSSKFSLTSIENTLNTDERTPKNDNTNRHEKIENTDDYKFDFGTNDTNRGKKLFKEKSNGRSITIQKPIKKNDFEVVDTYKDKLEKHKYKLSNLNDRIIRNNPLYISNKLQVPSIEINPEIVCYDFFNHHPQIVKGSAFYIVNNKSPLSAVSTEISLNTEYINKLDQKVGFPSLSKKPFSTSIENVQSLTEKSVSADLSPIKMSYHNIETLSRHSSNKSQNGANPSLDTWAKITSSFYSNLKQKSQYYRMLNKKVTTQQSSIDKNSSKD